MTTPMKTLTMGGTTYEIVDDVARNQTYTRADVDSLITGVTNRTYTKAEVNTVINNAKTDILDQIYPVGSIYLTLSENNPASMFGGTWQAFGQGRMLVGAGTDTDDNGVEATFEANDSGGEYVHTLTADEIPAHSHGINWNQSSFEATGFGLEAGGAFTDRAIVLVDAPRAGGTNAAGGGQAHDNMPPYLAVYMWLRTA